MRTMREALARWYEEKRKTLAQLLGAVAIAAVAIGVASFAGGLDPAVAPAVVAEPAKRTVLITLTGERVDTADITVRVGDDTSQETVDVPLTSTSGTDGMQLSATPGTFIYFSAQMPGEFGELTCELTSDGRRVSTSTSSVDYGIVTCSGTA
jgi:hypothetical protein